MKKKKKIKWKTRRDKEPGHCKKDKAQTSSQLPSFKSTSEIIIMNRSFSYTLSEGVLRVPVLFTLKPWMSLKTLKNEEKISSFTCIIHLYEDCI